MTTSHWLQPTNSPVKKNKKNPHSAAATLAWYQLPPFSSLAFFFFFFAFPTLAPVPQAMTTSLGNTAKPL